MRSLDATVARPLEADPAWPAWEPEPFQLPLVEPEPRAPDRRPSCWDDEPEIHSRVLILDLA